MKDMEAGTRMKINMGTDVIPARQRMIQKLGIQILLIYVQMQFTGRREKIEIPLQKIFA